MSKKRFLILAAGGIAGWVAAKRLFGDTDSWDTSSDAFDQNGPKPTPLWESRPESPPKQPIVTAGDPFRGAFAGAMAEIEAREKEQEDQDTQVA